MVRAKDLENVRLTEDDERSQRHQKNCDETEGLWSMISKEQYFERFLPGLRETRPPKSRIVFDPLQTTNSRKDGEQNFVSLTRCFDIT